VIEGEGGVEQEGQLRRSDLVLLSLAGREYRGIGNGGYRELYVIQGIEYRLAVGMQDHPRAATRQFLFL